jgi:hypothetical protein
MRDDHGNRPVRPVRTYASLDAAYKHFNRHLFGGLLPSCIITLQRHKGAYGYFVAARMVELDDGEDRAVDEIAVDPIGRRRRRPAPGPGSSDPGGTGGPSPPGPASPQNAIGVSVQVPPETSSTWMPKIDGPPIGNQASGVGVARYCVPSIGVASVTNVTESDAATNAPTASRKMSRQVNVALVVVPTAPSRTIEAPPQG